MPPKPQRRRIVAVFEKRPNDYLALAPTFREDFRESLYRLL